MKKLTINQLLDKITDIDQSLMTIKLKRYKRNLTKVKMCQLEGGLIIINNTKEILDEIEINNERI